MYNKIIKNMSVPMLTLLYYLLTPGTVLADSTDFIDLGDLPEPVPATLDIVTGFIWLDVDLTLGLSMEQISPLFEPGMALEGLRYATEYELYDMVCRYMGQPPESGASQQWKFANIQTDYLLLLDLVSLLGLTLDETQPPFVTKQATVGLLAPGQPASASISAKLTDLTPDFPVIDYLNTLSFSGSAGSQPSTGSFLILDTRSIVVPTE